VIISKNKPKTTMATTIINIKIENNEIFYDKNPLIL
jgi:hypothetical protein